MNVYMYDSEGNIKSHLNHSVEIEYELVPGTTAIHLAEVVDNIDNYLIVNGELVAKTDMGVSIDKEYSVLGDTVVITAQAGADITIKTLAGTTTDVFTSDTYNYTPATVGFYRFTVSKDGCKTQQVSTIVE